MRRSEIITIECPVCGKTFTRKSWQIKTVCGLDEECCLQVHHVDKDRNNDDINNLIILCANCHCRVHRGNLELTEEILNNREMV